MPLLNPFYWLMALLLLAVVLIMTVGAGAAAYAISAAVAKPKTPQTFRRGLPFGLAVGGIAFCVMCSGVNWYTNHPFLFQPEPTITDFEGVWAATPASLIDMQRNGGYTLSTHTVTFRADGRFELVNMPDWCLNFGKSSQGFLSGSGTWKISQDADHWVIYLFFDRTSGAAGLPGQMFIEGWRPRAIFEYIGDPDEGHAMRYEKTI